MVPPLRNGRPVFSGNTSCADWLSVVSWEQGLELNRVLLWHEESVWFLSKLVCTNRRGRCGQADIHRVTLHLLGANLVTSQEYKMVGFCRMNKHWMKSLFIFLSSLLLFITVTFPALLGNQVSCYASYCCVIYLYFCFWLAWYSW